MISLKKEVGGESPRGSEIQSGSANCISANADCFLLGT